MHQLRFKLSELTWRPARNIYRVCLSEWSSAPERVTAPPGELPYLRAVNAWQVRFPRAGEDFGDSLDNLSF